jgi:hypothetical protein
MCCRLPPPQCDRQGGAKSQEQGTDLSQLPSVKFSQRPLRRLGDSIDESGLAKLRGCAERPGSSRVACVTDAAYGIVNNSPTILGVFAS